MSLDVSPDGRRIIFDLVGDIYAMPIGGGTASRITSGPAMDAQPRFSPEGTQIVFASDRSGAEQVWVMNADGSSPRALTRGDNAHYVSPTFTPMASTWSWRAASIRVSRSATCMTCTCTTSTVGLAFA